MTRELSQDDELMGIKLQFDAFLAEYKIVRDVADSHRQMQGQLDSIALAALGLSIPLVLAIIDRSPSAIGAILLIPILFFAIAYVQLRHERSFIFSIIYLHVDLRPQIDRLLSKLSMNKVSVFAYEKFYAQHGWVSNILLAWIVAASHAGISLAIGVGLIVVYFYLRLALFKLDWNTYEVWLLVTNFAFLLGILIIAFFIGRIRYSFRTRRLKEARDIIKGSG